MWNNRKRLRMRSWSRGAYERFCTIQAQVLIFGVRPVLLRTVELITESTLGRLEYSLLSAPVLKLADASVCGALASQI